MITNKFEAGSGSGLQKGDHPHLSSPGHYHGYTHKLNYYQIKDPRSIEQ